MPKLAFPKRHTHADVRSREYLTAAEVTRLRKAARSMGRHGLRNDTMILLAYRHGLRVSELIRLRWDQFDLDQGFFGSVSKVEVDCDRCHTGLEGIAPQAREWPMTLIAVRCPHCYSEQIIKRGKTARGTQRYLCQNALCTTGSFLLDYRNRGCVSEVKQQIIDMSLNASGVRDTARSLHISPTTVLSELKKKEGVLESVNTALLRTLNPEKVAVDIAQAGEAEMDEMWSFVGNKGNPRWLWHAIDHHTGKVLAYVFGRRQDTVFLQLKALLEPFGITQYYTDYWGAYRRHLAPEEHTTGKRNTQKIERKHLTLRTRIKRLVRKTICFSKSIQMHDIVIGLFVNRYAFGRAV